MRRYHSTLNVVVKNFALSSVTIATHSTFPQSSFFCHQRKSVRGKLWEKGEVLKISTWNVRSLEGLGRTNLLAKELSRAGVMVCGVTETHLPGAGLHDATG